MRGSRPEWVTLEGPPSQPDRLGLIVSWDMPVEECSTLNSQSWESSLCIWRPNLALVVPLTPAFSIPNTSIRRRQWHPTPVFLLGESQRIPGGLPSMGLHRVGHDWSDLAARYYNYKLLVIWQIIICHTTSVTGLCTFVHTHSCFYSFIKLRIIYWTLHVLINYDIDIHVILIPNSFNPRP